MVLSTFNVGITSRQIGFMIDFKSRETEFYSMAHSIRYYY